MLSLTSPRHTPTHMGTFGSSGLDSAAHVQNSRSCFGIQGLSLIARSGRFLARSNSHSVAVRDGRTNIPLAAVGAQEDDTILYLGFLGHVGVRFVHLDPPELIRSWKI